MQRACEQSLQNDSSPTTQKNTSNRMNASCKFKGKIYSKYSRFDMTQVTFHPLKFVVVIGDIPFPSGEVDLGSPHLQTEVVFTAAR